MQHKEPQIATATTKRIRDASFESWTAATASLQQQLKDRTPINSESRVGPGLLLFPGTAQRHHENLVSKNLNMKTGTEMKMETENANSNANENEVVANQRKPCSIRSFRRPPLWQPQSEIMKKTEKLPEKLDIKNSAYMSKAQAFIIEFLQGSSIHGFIYLAKVGLNFLER